MIHCLMQMPSLTDRKRVILMTGTPAVSRPMELYTQLTAVRCPIYKVHFLRLTRAWMCCNVFVPSQSFRPFGLRYCQGFRGRWGWDWSGAAHLQELYAILSQKVMVRRLKQDVLTELPDKTRQVTACCIGHKRACWDV